MIKRGTIMVLKRIYTQYNLKNVYNMNTKTKENNHGKIIHTGIY